MDDRDQVREGLLYLEQQGWSDLIDARWTSDVIKELKNRFPNITESVLNEIIDLVIY